MASRALTVHTGVSPQHAVALIAATDRPTVTTAGGLTTYSGTALVEKLAKDEFAGELYAPPTAPDTAITVDYEVTVDDDFVVQKLSVSQQITSMGQVLPPDVLTVTYADWGKGGKLAPPG